MLGRNPWMTLAAAVVLGVLPHAIWAAFGLAGGLFVALLYPAIAGFVGWSIHTAAAGRCAKPVILCAALSAASFAAIFFVAAPDLSEFYGQSTIIAGGASVFVGAFLAASVFISIGVAARHAKRA